MSIDTDFLVFGLRPQLPIRPSEEYDIADNIMRNYNLVAQRVQQYDLIRKDGAALDVPTFNISRFFYFIGFYKQANSAG